jgi:hypothetical protein
MGVSTGAILAFGIDLGAGDDLPESLADVEDGLEEWLYGQKDLPFEAITHCSYDYPMYFLAAKGTQVRANRGHPSVAQMTQATPEQIEAMRAFCEQHGLEWKEPSWQIFRLWG